MASERGSARLGRVCAFGPEQLDKVIGRLREERFEIIDWECKGQPQPDFFAGTIQVKQDRLGRAAEVLGTGLGQNVYLEICPYGIPVPDFFHVAFKSGGIRG